MSGDLVRLEPPTKLLEMSTMRWKPLCGGTAVNFTVQEETRARAMLVSLHHENPDLGKPLQKQTVKLHRVRAALDFMRFAAKNFGENGDVTLSDLIEGQKAWDTLRAAVLAEQIHEAGDE